MIKALPIGLKDYIEATKTYYIDKTLTIKDIVDFLLVQSVLVTINIYFEKEKRYGL